MAKSKVDWNNAWGAVVGGGVQGGAVVGAGGSLLMLHNLGEREEEIACLVAHARAGAWAGVSAAHAVAIALNVRSAAQLHGYKSSGWDFQIDIGVKVGTVLKGGKVLGKLLLEAGKQVVGKKATRDLLKNIVENITRTTVNYGPDTTRFLMLATPAGGGLGLGVFYEWLTVYTTGRLLWQKAKVYWRIEQTGSAIELQMRNVPAENGAKLWIQLIDRDLRGDDAKTWFDSMKDDVLQVKGAGPARFLVTVTSRSISLKGLEKHVYEGYGGEKQIELILAVYDDKNGQPGELLWGADRFGMQWPVDMSPEGRMVNANHWPVFSGFPAHQERELAEWKKLPW